MHGNILDANSTNKLINQSVKDAVDDKLNESGYITKDLLEAETSARTNGDEDLSSKIKAEQTRAEGKEKEISDKLAIVDGDSNTEGSFRKAIADVIAAAPEDLDTLKEIADKLAGNDDLHTALNQAITEKADASALANEVSRATGAESGLQAAIATKADATALSNYVLTTALNQQVDTLNAAISAKQDAGSYIPYDQTVTSRYKIDKDLMIDNSGGSAVLSTYNISAISNSNTEIQINPNGIIMINEGDLIRLNTAGITLPGGDFDHVLTSNGSTINMANYLKESDVSGQFAAKADRSDLITLEQKITANTTAIEGKQDKGNYVAYSSEDDDNYYFHKGFISSVPFSVDDSYGNEVKYGINGITSTNHPNCFATTSGFEPTSNYVLKTELPAVPTKTSQLTNDSNFITADYVDDNGYTLQRQLKFGNEVDGYSTIGKDSITVGDEHENFDINKMGFRGHGIHSNCSFATDGVYMTSDGNIMSIDLDQIVSSANGKISFLIDSDAITLGDPSIPKVKISSEGIRFADKTDKDIPTADGTFINVNDLASADDVSSLRAGLSRKQNKITVNEVDTTDIETADITKLRTIVTNLINALSASDLIRETKTIE